VRRTAVRALYELKTLVAPHPGLALPLARWRARRGHGEAVGPGTELVIEGYPRSGNNFALAAFRLAQGRPVRVAHHTHAPATVMVAVRRSIPALVLIRDPEEAVLEFVIRRPELSPAGALRGYIRFYRPLLPYRGGFVVGAFSEVTTDFGAVIRRVNDRFGTAFAPFEHTEENVRACFRAIEEHYRAVGTLERFEAVVARPSPERDRMKDALRPIYRARTPDRLRLRARELLETLAPAEVRAGGGTK
jgi:hypothetical protein